MTDKIQKAEDKPDQAMAKQLEEAMKNPGVMDLIEAYEEYNKLFEAFLPYQEAAAIRITEILSDSSTC